VIKASGGSKVDPKIVNNQGFGRNKNLNPLTKQMSSNGEAAIDVDNDSDSSDED